MGLVKAYQRADIVFWICNIQKLQYWRQEIYRIYPEIYVKMRKIIQNIEQILILSTKNLNLPFKLTLNKEKINEIISNKIKQNKITLKYEYEKWQQTHTELLFCFLCSKPANWTLCDSNLEELYQWFECKMSKNVLIKQCLNFGYYHFPSK